MRKINKILVGVSAAAIALGSTAAYVAGAVTYPGDDDYSKFEGAASDYTVSGSGSAVTVTFKYTKETVQKAVTDGGLGSAAGTAPVYLTIATGITNVSDIENVSLTGSYDWDDPAHKEYNFDTATGDLMLWLPAILTDDAITVGISVDGTDDATGESFSATITYAYADEDPVEGGDNSDENSSEEESSDPESSDSETSSDPTPSYPPITNPGTSDDSNGGTTTTPDQVIEGEADVTPGTAAKVETDAGEITVTTDAEDEALAGTKFVVGTVKNANADLTTAVGASATEETKGMVTAAAKAVTDGNAIILDLSFEKDGKDVQPGKAVTLEIPVPAALKGAGKVYIYHVSDDGFTLVASPDVKDGKITFTAEKFSPYIFSKIELKAAGNTANPGGTTGNPATGIALAVAPVVLAAGFVTVVAAKKKH